MDSFRQTIDNDLAKDLFEHAEFKYCIIDFAYFHNP